MVAEPRTVPSPRVGRQEEQGCVHLPDRGGRRCLELHGDSGKVIVNSDCIMVTVKQ